jgi:hypothetical protein
VLSLDGECGAGAPGVMRGCPFFLLFSRKASAGSVLPFFRLYNLRCAAAFFFFRSLSKSAAVRMGGAIRAEWFDLCCSVDKREM